MTAVASVSEVDRLFMPDEEHEPDLEEVWQQGGAPGNYDLAVRDIVILPSVSPRDIRTTKNSPAPVDQKTVRKYAKEMQAGDEFPPILVGALRIDNLNDLRRRPSDMAAFTKGKEAIGRGSLPLLVLIDGMHRIMARQTVTNWIAAKVIELESLDEARWLALTENCAHGLNLKAKEKRKKFDAYIGAKKYRDSATGRVKSLRTMADEVGLSHEQVRRKLKADYPPIFGFLSRRDNEEEPLPEMDLEDMARMRAEKVQRELADEAINFAKAALAHGLRVEDPQTRKRVAKALEEAAGSLRKTPQGGPLTISNWDPETAPLDAGDMSEFLNPKSVTETDA